MKSLRVLSVVIATLLSSTPLLAEPDFPKSGEDPGPYLAKVQSGAPCEETLREKACWLARQLQDRALGNLAGAQSAFEQAEGMGETADSIGATIAVGAGSVFMVCSGAPSPLPLMNATYRLMAKIGEGMQEARGYEYLKAAQACLEASVKWAEICEHCCKGRGQPQQQTVIDKNPTVDFRQDVPPEHLRELLGGLSDEERKATREAAADGSLDCTDANRQAILQMIDGSGKLKK